MNEVYVTVVGLVCTEIRVTRTDDGVQAARFQVRSVPRRFDAKRSGWSDGAPSYYSATCWRRLGDHAAVSLRLGDPVILTGKLAIGRWRRGEDVRVSASIDVQAIGHDLRWGTSSYVRGGDGALTAQPTVPEEEDAGDDPDRRLDGDLGGHIEPAIVQEAVRAGRPRGSAQPSMAETTAATRSSSGPAGTSTSSKPNAR